MIQTADVSPFSQFPPHFPFAALLALSFSLVFPAFAQNPARYLAANSANPHCGIGLGQRTEGNRGKRVEWVPFPPGVREWQTNPPPRSAVLPPTSIRAHECLCVLSTAVILVCPFGLHLSCCTTGKQPGRQRATHSAQGRSLGLRFSHRREHEHMQPPANSR